MSNKIPMSLSVASIKDTIKKLKTAQEIVEKSKVVAISKVLNDAHDVIALHTPVDTGETLSSLNIEIGSTRAKITQSGDHVFENEFGDGSLAGSYPGERPSGFPTHTGDYYFVPTNPSSKYYETYKRKKRPLHSEGQIAHAQMYHGSQYIRKNISKEIKKEVSDALSKI